MIKYWETGILTGGAVSYTGPTVKQAYQVQMSTGQPTGSKYLRGIVEGHFSTPVLGDATHQPESRWIASASGAIGIWFDSSGTVPVADVPDPLSGGAPSPYWLQKKMLRPVISPAWPGRFQQNVTWEIPGGGLDTKVSRDSAPGARGVAWLSWAFSFPVDGPPPFTAGGVSYGFGVYLNLSSLWDIP